MRTASRSTSCRSTRRRASAARGSVCQKRRRALPPTTTPDPSVGANLSLSSSARARSRTRPRRRQHARRAPATRPRRTASSSSTARSTARPQAALASSSSRSTTRGVRPGAARGLKRSLLDLQRDRWCRPVINDDDGPAVFSKAPCTSAANGSPSLQVATLGGEQRPSARPATNLSTPPSPDTTNRDHALGAAKPTQKKSAKHRGVHPERHGNIATLDPASGAKGPTASSGGTGVTDDVGDGERQGARPALVGAGDPGTEPVPVEDGGAGGCGHRRRRSTSDTTLRLQMFEPKIAVETIRTTRSLPSRFPGLSGRGDGRPRSSSRATRASGGR